MKGSKVVKKGGEADKNKKDLIIKEQIGENSPSWPASKKDFFLSSFAFFYNLSFSLVFN